VEFESVSASSLDQVGDYRLECGEECSEQGENESPGGKVVVSICAILSASSYAKVALAYANPTPATTGSSEISFIALNLARRRTVAIRMVNKGVEARTTWWNWAVSSCSA